MDAEDLVTSALEPGEKIVWSDRPHVDFWLGASRRTPLQIVWLGIVWLVWLFFVVQALSFALMPVGPNPRVDSPRNIGRVELAVLTLIALLEVAWRVSTMLRHGKIRYTVTDRQRLIMSTASTRAPFRSPLRSRSRRGPREPTSSETSSSTRSRFAV